MKALEYLKSKSGNKLLNTIIYTLFFVVVIILGVNCYLLKIEASKNPEVVWKEYRTTEYVEVEKPVEKIVYKTIYKEKEKLVNTNVTYDNQDGVILVNIGE